MIGPSIESELEQANLKGLPFTWDDDGNIHFDELIGPAAQSQIRNVFRNHDPNTEAPPGPRSKARTKVENARNLAELKEAVLELLDKAVVTKGRSL